MGTNVCKLRGMVGQQMRGREESQAAAAASAGKLLSKWSSSKGRASDAVRDGMYALCLWRDEAARAQDQGTALAACPPAFLASQGFPGFGCKQCSMRIHVFLCRFFPFTCPFALFEIALGWVVLGHIHNAEQVEKKNKDLNFPEGGAGARARVERAGGQAGLRGGGGTGGQEFSRS